MPWKEVASGEYERGLDPMDEFMVTVKHLCINASVVVDFGGTAKAEIEARLLKAWNLTRYHHPFIAASLNAANDRITYQVPSAAGLDKWVNETFSIEQGTFADFSRTLPQPYCALHYFPSSSELVLRGHHWLVDGIGAMHVLNKLLSFVVEDGEVPRFGDEAKNLAPAFDELLGVSTEPSERAEQMANGMFMDFVGNLPGIGLPCTMPSKDQGAGTKRHLIRSSQSTQKGLLAACKQRGISVTAAVHAAIVSATQEMKVSDPMAKNYTSILVYDYRQYLPSPYNDTNAWPANNFVLGLPTSLPPDTFHAHADRLQHAYGQPRRFNNDEDNDRKDFVDSIFSYSKRLAGAFSQPPPPGILPSCPPQLSSVGPLEKLISPQYSGAINVRVRNAELGVDVINAPFINMYQWSWESIFHLSACYSKSFAEEELVERFLKRTYEILLHEMGVEEQ